MHSILKIHIKMKKILLSLVLISTATSVFADLNGNGYYRVRNVGTTRWASLVDDWSSNIDYVAGTADLHALSLTKDTEAILSNPASIVYVDHLSGYRYNVGAQGVTLESLINNAVNIGEYKVKDGQKTYLIWGTKSGATKYISDGQLLPIDKGTATLNENTAEPELRQWFFLPVEADGDNYFAAVPSVEANGGLYTTLYTSFSYAPYSEGLKFYAIGRTGEGMAEMIEIGDAVSAGTPVIVKCAGTQPVNNKLEIVNEGSVVSQNALTGVYFNYTSNDRSNHVAYNPATMRILGTCADGSLGFVTSNIQYIPANTVYLNVAPGSPSELKCVTSEEFDDNMNSGVESIIDSSSTLTFYNNTVYGSDASVITIVNLAGQTVMTTDNGIADVSALAKGVYVATQGTKSIKFIR